MILLNSTYFYVPEQFIHSPPQWGAANADSKSNLISTQSLKVLPLKTGVGQYIAMHATLIAKDLLFANFYPSRPFTCIFSKISPKLFPVLAAVNTGSCAGPQNKTGHLAGCRFPC